MNYRSNKIKLMDLKAKLQEQRERKKETGDELASGLEGDDYKKALKYNQAIRTAIIETKKQIKALQEIIKNERD